MLVKSVVLFGTFIPALCEAAAIYPYWNDTYFNETISELSKRDTDNFWGVYYRDGGCDGTANYGAYGEDTLSCYNLATDKPWDTLGVYTHGGTDVMFFEQLDCCTSSSNTPCSIYTGYQENTCVKSIGSGKTGQHFAKSFAVVPHAYNGNGAATTKSCAAAGGEDCPASSDPPSCKRSSDKDLVQSCADAPNCELWQDKSNRTRVRFVDGMGPDSDWYHTNVRLPEQMHQKRQDGCPSDVHYNPERSQGTIQYGLDRDDIAASMYDHCQEGSCKTMWELDNVYYINGNGEKAQQTLKFTGDGEWDAADENQRDYFIKSITAHGKPSKSNEVEYYNGPPDASKPTYKGTTYYGTVFVNTNRFSNGNLQGFATLMIDKENGDEDACDFVVSILTGAVGEVSAIGSSFFGELGKAICRTLG